MTLAAGAFRLGFSTLIFVLIRSWVDPADVRYALVWWQPAGFFARLSLAGQRSRRGNRFAAGLQMICPPCRFSCSDRGMAELMTSYVLFPTIRYAREILLFERAQRRRQRPGVHPKALSTLEVSIFGLGVPGGR